jgi:hypothetical protein
MDNFEQECDPMDSRNNLTIQESTYIGDVQQVICTTSGVYN